MSEFWMHLAEREVEMQPSLRLFWNGVKVYIDRPHLVNRKLLGTEVLQSLTVPHSWMDLELGGAELTAEKFQNLMNNVLTAENLKQTFSTRIMTENDATQVFLIRKLIPRNLSMFSEVLEIVIRDEKENVVTFWPKHSDVINSMISPTFPYRIKLVDKRIVLEVYKKDAIPTAKEQASEKWLSCCVLPKIVKWCCNSPTTPIVSSLNLVSANNYSKIYHYLKEKYAKKYIEIWPECSDPLKYVYEDIAIAAYLMTLWENERKLKNISVKQTFVDLGCGNGLLVDILSSEGHLGIGIDVRKRKIWDLYEKSTVLIEKTVEPSDYNIFPNYDWIIGNHSDELTPWIPVIAARSHYNMKVFLLPCCAFTFNGKYQRSFQGTSQYQSYLCFIHILCESMGFVVQEDKLRIPSTKRTCFVCSFRTYKKEEEEDIDSKRQVFIKVHSNKYPSTSNMSKCESLTSTTKPVSVSKDTNWIEDFKPREKVEVVQNCSQLDRKFLENTVLTIATILIKTDNYILLKRGSETIQWNAGGKMKLSELIKMIDSDVLRCMKNQSGGFQTFLRNHRNVFQIIDGDVQLTVPVKGIPLNSKPAAKRKRFSKYQYNFKEKPCFFFFNHPQGCPLEDSDCNFSHKTF